MTRERDTSVPRVLIALDPAAPMTATLDALSGLTSGLRPHVEGLFVEDTRLFALSALSIAREVTLDTAEERPIQRDVLERQMRAQRARVEEMLTNALRGLALEVNFRVARGAVIEELQRAAREADLLVVGRSHYVAGARSWMGMRLASLAAETARTAGTLAIVQDAWATGNTVMVLYEGSSSSVRALTLASRLAHKESLALAVVLAGDAEECTRWRREIEALPLSCRADRWYRTEQPASDTVVRLARENGCRVVFLPARALDPAGSVVDHLMRELDTSVVVVGESLPPPPANDDKAELPTAGAN